MNEDKGTRYRRAERTLRAFEVTVATAILCAVAVSPLPEMLRAIGDAAVGSTAGPVAAFAKDTGVAAAILAVSLALPALAASRWRCAGRGDSPDATTCLVVSGRAYVRREPASRPARRGGRRIGLVGLRAPGVAHAVARRPGVLGIGACRRPRS